MKLMVLLKVFFLQLRLMSVLLIEDKTKAKNDFNIMFKP